jgi:hypothetical protein
VRHPRRPVPSPGISLQEQDHKKKHDDNCRLRALQRVAAGDERNLMFEDFGPWDD